jgi:hypothetical protein
MLHMLTHRIKTDSKGRSHRPLLSVGQLSAVTTPPRRAPRVAVRVRALDVIVAPEQQVPGTGAGRHWGQYGTRSPAVGTRCPLRQGQELTAGITWLLYLSRELTTLLTLSFLRST